MLSKIKQDLEDGASLPIFWLGLYISLVKMNVLPVFSNRVL